MNEAIPFHVIQPFFDKVIVIIAILLLLHFIPIWIRILRRGGGSRSRKGGSKFKRRH